MQEEKGKKRKGKDKKRNRGGMGSRVEGERKEKTDEELRRRFSCTFKSLNTASRLSPDRD